MQRRKMDKYAKYTLYAGFTLVELLVAVAVFATMAAMAWGGLDSIVHTRNDLAREEEDFRALARTVASIDRDLRQAVARSVHGNYGQPIPAFLGGPDKLEITRVGFANPQAEQRSNLERVVYGVDGEKLARGTYPVLDRTPATQAQMNLLRDRVRSFRLRYLDAQQRWVGAWPEPSGDGTPTVLPRAVEVRIETQDYGEITHVVELVSDWPTAAAPTLGAQVMP